MSLGPSIRPCFGSCAKIVDSVLETLLFHTQISWHSRGKVVKKVFDLQEEIKELFNLGERWSPKSSSPNWKTKIGSLTSPVLGIFFFTRLSDLNKTVQGRNVFVLYLLTNYRHSFWYWSWGKWMREKGNLVCLNHWNRVDLGNTPKLLATLIYTGASLFHVHRFTDLLSRSVTAWLQTCQNSIYCQYSFCYSCISKTTSRPCN